MKLIVYLQFVNGHPVYVTDDYGLEYDNIEMFFPKAKLN